MREIEELAKPHVEQLLLGNGDLLTPSAQSFVATFLCLVTIRIALTNRRARGIPPQDHQHLMERREPPSSWLIWIMRCAEGGDDYWYSNFPMAMMAAKSAEEIMSSLERKAVGPEHCNTQVTTMAVGRLCAHVFSTTVYHDFRGYAAPKMTPIWPLSGWDIDTRFLPRITREDVRWLHETIARERDAPRPVRRR